MAFKLNVDFAGDVLAGRALVVKLMVVVAAAARQARTGLNI